MGEENETESKKKPVKKPSRVDWKPDPEITTTVWREMHFVSEKELFGKKKKALDRRTKKAQNQREKESPE